MRIGPVTDPVLNAAGSETLAVGTSETLYTHSFKLTYAEFFAVCYKAASSGTPHLLIQLEQSWVEPTAEGSQDNNWVVPENMQDIETALATKTQHHKNLSPIPLPWGRFKIYGDGTNPSGTTLAMRIAKQEE